VGCSLSRCFAACELAGCRGPVNLIRRPVSDEKKQAGIQERYRWLAYGIYVGIAIVDWIETLRGYLPLEGTLLYTFLTPIVLFAIFRIRESKHQITFMKLVTVIGGGSVLGFPLWLLLNYVLYVPSWAPFHGNHSLLGGIVFLLSTAISYGGAAYIMYRLGKKRNFNSFM